MPKTPSARRPRWTPTSTLSARSSIAQPTIFCQRQGETPGAGSPTPSWSRSASPRRSWASRPTAGSWPRRGSASSTCSPSCPARALTTSAAAGSPTRSSGSWACSPARARAPVTTCCWSTRPRCPAPPAARRSSVRRSQRLPATATAPPTRACYWGFRLHLLAAPDGTPRAFTLADPGRGEREVALELLARCRRETVACLVCDKGYAGREFAAGAAKLGVLVVRPRRARTSRARGPHLAPIRQRIESYLLDLQGPAHAGASRCPDHGRSSRAYPAALPLPGCLHQPQPPAWQAEPGSRRLLRLRLRAWNQSSSGRAVCRRARGLTARPGIESNPKVRDLRFGRIACSRA